MSSYAALRALFGDADAARFLLTLHRQSSASGRLYYWQEKMLAGLSSEGYDIRTLEEALTAFNHCHVHDAELVAGEVPIRYGTWAPPQADEVRRSDAMWPFANVEVFGPCWVEEARQRSVMFCSGCRAALAAHTAIVSRHGNS